MTKTLKAAVFTTKRLFRILGEGGTIPSEELGSYILYAPGTHHSEKVNGDNFYIAINAEEKVLIIPEGKGSAEGELMAKGFDKNRLVRAFLNTFASSLIRPAPMKATVPHRQATNVRQSSRRSPHTRDRARSSQAVSSAKKIPR